MNLVFVHGPVASGKLTIAKELGRITGYAVFHNHLVVDAVAAVFPFGTEQFVRLRERMRLDVMREAAIANRLSSSPLRQSRRSPKASPSVLKRA